MNNFQRHIDLACFNSLSRPHVAMHHLHLAFNAALTLGRVDLMNTANDLMIIVGA